MAEVLDLATERQKRAPIPDLVRSDADGEPIYFFSGLTAIGGREHVYSMWAHTQVEVAGRIHAMRLAHRRLFGAVS